VVQVWFKKK